MQVLYTMRLARSDAVMACGSSHRNHKVGEWIGFAPKDMWSLATTCPCSAMGILCRIPCERYPHPRHWRHARTARLTAIDVAAVTAL